MGKTPRSPLTELAALRENNIYIYIFEEKFGLFAYTESQLEDRRIYNAAINREF